MTKGKKVSRGKKNHQRWRISGLRVGLNLLTPGGRLYIGTHRRKRVEGKKESHSGETFYRIVVHTIPDQGTWRDRIKEGLKPETEGVFLKREDRLGFLKGAVLENGRGGVGNRKKKKKKRDL